MSSIGSIKASSNIYNAGLKRNKIDIESEQSESIGLLNRAEKKEFKPVDIKAINANCYRQYSMNNFGENVFDLSKIADKMDNQPAFSEVKQFKDDEGRTVFRCHLIKPNSDKLITVDIALRNYDGNEKMDDETFMKSVAKAILIMDKHISMAEISGDKIPDHLAPEFTFDPTSKSIDFSPLLEELKNDLTVRAAGNSTNINPFWNKNVDRKMVEENYREMERFILELIQNELEI